ncbi:MAG: hypothetical protein CUN49_10915 [Candidatus Thermofonsia Clade 1 bacterium]|jgi:hypothetical protein|uniref:Uncharacterized protein n=1 Tax=Candidatus Thermofonsia Clade 1 bacterium TaxID=2364210 RepID=A0A2M8PCW1_9CHLR|nr:MAG: hypothetical protein CUN49_10915 [Candidatus Thermofonsia Clade 1 bacterium]RMF54188.1 MAG: hypothetical protein D6749_00180 [Chloroflexota bacterium]
MLFPYYAERVTCITLIAALALIVFGVALGGLFGIALGSSGAGIGLWALLQGLRQGRGVRLYDTYLLVQGSVTGRVRRIPYSEILGLAFTRRGGLALLYHQAVTAQEALPSEALVGLRAAEQAPSQRFLLTARLAQPEALRAALLERLSSSLRVPEAQILRLARRQRLRDALIVLLALLATPLYVLIFSRVLLSALSGAR